MFSVVNIETTCNYFPEHASCFFLLHSCQNVLRMIKHGPGAVSIVSAVRSRQLFILFSCGNPLACHILSKEKGVLPT